MSGFELQEELHALQELESYVIPNDHDFSTEDPEILLEGRAISQSVFSIADLCPSAAAVEVVAESSSSITDGEIFDVYRSILKHAGTVPGSVMSKLLDSVSSGLQAELEATLRDIDTGNQQVYMEHKTPLEMYAFLLSWFVTAAESVKTPEEGDAPPLAKGRGRGRGGKAAATKAGGRAGAKKGEATWTWQDQMTPTLLLIGKVLQKLQSQRIWTASAEKDTFIKYALFKKFLWRFGSSILFRCLTRPAYYVTESEQYMKVPEIRMAMYKVVCLAVKLHGQALAVQITIIQSLQFYEHLAEPMADCLAILSSEFDYAQLADEVLREIAGKTFTGQDRGPRTFARFLTKYTESCPRSVLKQLSLLQVQLDSEVRASAILPFSLRSSDI